MYTQQWYSSYRFADSKLSANLYDEYHCCVYNKEPLDDGQRNRPKHVEFYSRNKFEELVHLVGFIIRTKRSSRIGRTNIATLFITLLRPKLIYTSHQHLSCASPGKHRYSVTKHQLSNSVYRNYHRLPFGTYYTCSWRRLELSTVKNSQTPFQTHRQ